MAKHLVVDEDLQEWITQGEIKRVKDVVYGKGAYSKAEGDVIAIGCWKCKYDYGKKISLPNGFIEKQIGRKLTWGDEPYKLED